MSEEFVCLYNFIEDDHAIETFFDNLSLRVKVVILDNVDPESDFYTKTIKSRYLQLLKKYHDVATLNGTIIIVIMGKALAIVLRTIAIAIAIEVKKSIEYCNMQ